MHEKTSCHRGYIPFAQTMMLLQQLMRVQPEKEFGMVVLLCTKMYDKVSARSLLLLRLDILSGDTSTELESLSLNQNTCRWVLSMMGARVFG
jgi:hypothetical protein